MHYKLDRGIDHVLIDEAQDTSPQAVGDRRAADRRIHRRRRRARRLKRTIFAVGDEKQSIFSFQGAVPREFAERRERCGAAFRKAELNFDKVSFNYSFRSGATILHAVDHVFRDAGDLSRRSTPTPATRCTSRCPTRDPA